MDWIIVIGLVVFGLFLLIAEIIFVPGTTIVGILGLIFSGYGVYLSYDYFGTSTGHIFLLCTFILNIIAFSLALRGKSWERFSLKNSMTGKVNEEFEFDLKVGDKGVSISSLKPIGKALFDNKEVEVKSNGVYIDENVEIEIHRIESTKVFVKPVNQ